ncbi:hypothetical protein C8J56DRAFT_1064057 [Mycena floridula]|nr:hypothetical protein C8J56DRAFT_1064057 [Mycena floridula]
MKWIKDRLLPEKWAEELLTELMGTKMRKGDLFKDYSEDMVFGNRLLEGTKQHQSDIQLRTQVTANLPSVLHSHAFSIVAQTYDEWADALIKQIKEDEDLRKRLMVSNAGITVMIQPASRSNQTLQPAFQPNPNPRSMQYLNQNQYNVLSNNQYQSNTYQNNQNNQFQPHTSRPNNNYNASQARETNQMNQALGRSDYPPRLITSEVFWLDLYGGCRGCHRFDILQGHQAANCDTPVMGHIKVQPCFHTKLGSLASL